MAARPRDLYPDRSARDFEARVAARMARQELLRSPMRPEFWAILDEAVLRRPVGGPTRMCDQLVARLPLMNTRHTTIQVLPFRHGEHALLNTNLFLLTLPNNSVVGYEESGWSGQLIDDEQAVRERKRAYDALKAYALPPFGLRDADPSGHGGVRAMRITPSLSSAHWRKSSHSNPDGGNCVEVADDAPGLVPVRDSKDPGGPALIFPGYAWSAFIDHITR